ncbi:MAG: exonuclease SbcCD subunit D C-terminal domain-containing protein [Varibaculum sp.]|nr:exonuclease SbcCD subunit D C-terminal domain-containing protein [Varibaculum sp.]
MRFLHTSDWHIGRTLHGQNLASEHRYFFSQLYTYAHRYQPDWVLVAGDFFDRGVPSVEAVRLGSEVLNKLCEQVPVVVTAGNHDSAVRLGWLADQLGDRLTICADGMRSGEPLAVPGGRLYALPYLDPGEYRERFSDPDTGFEVERSHQAVADYALGLVRDDLQINPPAAGENVVVTAHLFATGGQASESERNITVGGLDNVAAASFKIPGVDYVALGHLHRPQSISVSSDAAADEPTIRYSGSPLAFSFSESKDQKSVVLFDDGEVTELPITPEHRLSRIRGHLDDLLQMEEYRDDYLEITVTDDIRPLNLNRQLRAYFNFPLSVHHEPEHQVLRVGDNDGPTYNQMSIPETVNDFFGRFTGGLSAIQQEFLDGILNSEEMRKCE